MGLSLYTCNLAIYIYGPVIYAAPYVMVLMWKDPLRGQVGGGLALESRLLDNPLPLAQEIDLLQQNHYIQGRINQMSIGSFMYISFQGP